MPAPDPLHPWLAAFAPHQRSLVSAWFAYAWSQGTRTPEELVALVQRLVTSKLEWSVSPTSTTLCEVTLASLAHRRGEALAYAQRLLDHAQSTGRTP
jgi:hypothetical protein